MNYGYLLELAVLVKLCDEDIISQKQYFEAIEDLKIEYGVKNDIYI